MKLLKKDLHSRSNNLDKFIDISLRHYICENVETDVWIGLRRPIHLLLHMYYTLHISEHLVFTYGIKN